MNMTTHAQPVRTPLAALLEQPADARKELRLPTAMLRAATAHAIDRAESLSEFVRRAVVQTIARDRIVDAGRLAREALGGEVFTVTAPEAAEE